MMQVYSDMTISELERRALNGDYVAGLFLPPGWHDARFVESTGINSVFIGGTPASAYDGIEWETA